MGYMHIDNSYKHPNLFLEPELYALEKVDGTSAHVALRAQSEKLPEEIRYFGGCAKHEVFVGIFNEEELKRTFEDVRASWPGGGLEEITIYGEAYGGKLQGRREAYGDEIRFVAFDVKVRDRGVESWLDVPAAAELVGRFALRFVDFRRIPGTIAAADAERDRESVEAIRNGMGGGKWREGVVLRPIREKTTKAGARFMAKHKRPDARETKSPRAPDAARVAALEGAREIAEEWVTDERVKHVASKALAAKLNETKLGADKDSRFDGLEMSDTPGIIRATLEDVKREAGEEVAWSKDAERAVCTAAATSFKRLLTSGQFA